MNTPGTFNKPTHICVFTILHSPKLFNNPTQYMSLFTQIKHKQVIDNATGSGLNICRS